MHESVERSGVLSVERLPIGSGRETWEEFVGRHADATHCHRYAWQDVMRQVFGHECHYFVARRANGALEGVLPLVTVRSALFGHFVVSMPFLNYGGPIGSERAVVALARVGAAHAASTGAGLLELRSRRPWADPGAMWAASTRKITVLLDLPAGPGAASALWKGFDAKVRSQVRRPQKEGVTVRFGQDQVEPFFAVFSRHMRDLGTPTQPRRLFETIATVFPDDVWFGCAYLHGAPVAAGCGFRWGTEFEMTWASALSAYKRLAPNMLLYWAFMERAAEEGLRAFNFGRCTTGSGTHRFKEQWGTRDEQLWWYALSPRRLLARRVGKTPSPDDGAYAWGPRVWRNLPLRLANALGPQIVRYIP